MIGLPTSLTLMNVDGNFIKPATGKYSNIHALKIKWVKVKAKKLSGSKAPEFFC